MKILVIVTGVGYGDPVREDIILNELVKKKKAKKNEIIIAGYNNSYEYFKSKYQTIKIHGYKFPGYQLKFQIFSFLFLNLLLPFFWVYDSFNVKRVLKKLAFEPELIVSDF